ncbi:MAG: hypothetical protein IJZ72_05960 [Oscillospiraceae bacterium]|nr:hypothetical protein [Oscillospiraceae bacterium]
MFGKTGIQIIDSIEIPEKSWCDSAVVICVKNGKGTLKHVREDPMNYSDFASNLTLNGKPILQARYPFCCTCEGLLAAGCGIENVNCTELENIRSNFNSSYSDINSSAESLKPLLELLEDGYYLIADVPHYPADGSGNFFYSIPNSLTHIEGFCDSYYLSGLYTAVSTFPAFLIPTQSAALINRERVEFYKEKLQQSPDSVRGIAYYEYGFYSVLLDGHHKAYAAAELGLPLKCITIVPGFFYRTLPSEYLPSSAGVYFADMQLPESREIKVPLDVIRRENYEKIIPFVSSAAGLKSDISCIKYPTAEELAAQSELADRLTDFELTTDEWINSNDRDDFEQLKYAMAYFQKKYPPKAKALALKIISSKAENVPLREAWKTLASFRDHETEQLFVDFLANESKDHYAYDIVNSYWD